LLGYLCVTVASAQLPAEIPRIHEIRLDGTVLGFTALLAIAISVLIGLAPALSLSVRSLQSALQEGGRGSSAGRQHLHLRNLLVAGEIVVSMVLLVAAGLVMRSFEELQNVKLGFEPHNVNVANLSLARDRYKTPQQWVNFYDEVLRRMSEARGARETALAMPVPPFGSGFNFRFAIQGRAPRPAGQDFTANYSAVSPEYFSVLEIPLRRGRVFSSGDRPQTAKVCLISEEFARIYFPNEDPIGKALAFGYSEEAPRTIVGIVGDVKQVGLAAPVSPQMYVPYAQDPWWTMAVLGRSNTAREPFFSMLVGQVHEIDAGVPVAAAEPMTEAISESIAHPRFRSTLFGLFGLTALVLAAIGLFGVVSYFVTQRTREIGLRIALGAQRADVLKMIVWQGFRLAMAGVVVGLVLALALGRILASLLYGVSARDALTFSAAGGLLLFVALAASYVPAWRAARVEPTAALRAE
jgi:putative ABC transport system permease protein